MLRSVLYVSESALVISSADTRIADIVAQSRSWNASEGITGALVSTERRFVQFIEGPDAAIGDLLAKLHADRRHVHLKVIQDIEADHRYFQGWSLAYSGPDTFIDRDLPTQLFTQSGARLQTVANQLRDRLRSMVDANFSVPQPLAEHVA